MSREHEVKIAPLHHFAEQKYIFFRLGIRVQRLGCVAPQSCCEHFCLFRLMPIIEGGTYRVWSRTQDLQLSAEQSYDPNMDPHNQSRLHYAWDCQSTSKVISPGPFSVADASLTGMFSSSKDVS